MVTWIKKICIDVDQRTGPLHDRTERRINQHKNVKMWFKKKTRHGWHFFVILKREVTVWESFNLRYYFGDDYHRMVKDILRWHLHNDINLLDVCFDKKQRINEEIKV